MGRYLARKGWNATSGSSIGGTACGTRGLDRNIIVLVGCRRIHCGLDGGRGDLSSSVCCVGDDWNHRCYRQSTIGIV